MAEKKDFHKIVDLMGHTDDGRDLDAQISAIEEHGMHPGSAMLRNSIIGGLQLKSRKAGAVENLIVLGCYCFGTAQALISYCRLLQRLDVGYTLLRKEYCCAAPMIIYAEARDSAEERAKADEASKEFIGKNIAQARALDIKRMYHCCTWCAYLARRFYGDGDIPQHYYLDLVVDLVEQRGLPLKLDATIAYFPGGQHRRGLYVPDIKWNFDWPSYRRILDRIEGLRIVDVPRYCCVTNPERINQFVAEANADTLVTPCMTCYGRMLRKAPANVRVTTVPDLILEALDGAAGSKTARAEAHPVALPASR